MNRGQLAFSPTKYSPERQPFPDSRVVLGTVFTFSLDVQPEHLSLLSVTEIFSIMSSRFGLLAVDVEPGERANKKKQDKAKPKTDEKNKKAVNKNNSKKKKNGVDESVVRSLQQINHWCWLVKGVWERDGKWGFTIRKREWNRIVNGGESAFSWASRRSKRPNSLIRYCHSNDLSDLLR